MTENEALEEAEFQIEIDDENFIDLLEEEILPLREKVRED